MVTQDLQCRSVQTALPCPLQHVTLSFMNPETFLSIIIYDAAVHLWLGLLASSFMSPSSSPVKSIFSAMPSFTDA